MYNDREHTRKKLIIHGCVFTLCMLMFMVFDRDLENISIVVCFYGLYRIIRALINNVTKYDLLWLLIVALLVYSGFTGILMTKRYSMNIEKAEVFEQTSEKKAVLLVYEGEPQRYNIPILLNNLYLKKGAIQTFQAPFYLYNSKRSYRTVGRSFYKNESKEIQQKLQNLLTPTYDIYLGYLYDTKYVEEKIFEIAKNGYEKIIIVPVFLNDNKLVVTLKERVERLKFYNLNIQIKYTNPLWDSEKLVDAYIEKINPYINQERLSNIGIVLISKGENKYDNGMNTAALKQTIMFRNKVATGLISRKNLLENRIKKTWLRELEPDYISEVRSLLEYGVGHVVCIILDPQVKDIENQILLDRLRKKIDYPDGVDVRVINGFLKQKQLYEEIIKRIEFVDLQSWD